MRSGFWRNGKKLTCELVELDGGKDVIIVFLV